jgi:hypothetical protein
MYFTSEMQDLMETTEQSACLRFARDFMPIVNNALAQVYAEQPAAQAEVTDAASSAGPAETVSITPTDPAGATPSDASAVGTPAASPSSETPSAEDVPSAESGGAEPAAPQ